ncbi:hypothetical protein RJ639_031304 [Escallonia herrerae]|uniref:Reverse transcriptase RNase H-like domain-containing protein n=1 Tax=Escallonia herrerae TaxID=1293975 RepID=A0AA89BMD5_9ASTE|nr:hypothetical protein RJ639_031304 [Escallonia herrerae]
MKHGIGAVKRDQTTAHQCYVTSCRSKNKETLIIEDLREETKMQRGEPVKDLPSEKQKTLHGQTIVRNRLKNSRAVLVREEDGVQKPIYYVSKAFQDVEMRYPKIDKIALALITTAIKAQALADFIIECTLPEDPPQLVISEVPDPWNLYVDCSSAIGSSGAGIILTSTKGSVVETEAMLPVEVGVPTIRTLHFNEADNEAGLRANLDLVEELEVSDPKAATGKLSLNWEGPYCIIKVLKLGAYALRTLSGDPIPRTWNAENLQKYYQWHLVPWQDTSFLGG